MALLIVVIACLALVVVKLAGTDGGPFRQAPRRPHDEWSSDLPSRPYTER